MGRVPSFLGIGLHVSTCLREQACYFFAGREFGRCSIRQSMCSSAYVVLPVMTE